MKGWLISSHIGFSLYICPLHIRNLVKKDIKELHYCSAFDLWKGEFT